MSPRKYESSAVVEFIVPRLDEDVPREKRIQAEREFEDGQREEIVADLRQAIRELIPGAQDDLTAWFERSDLRVVNIKGTDLFRILVTSRDKRLSRDIANLLAEHYLRNHKPRNNAKGPTIHQKAEIGVPADKEQADVEQD